MPKRERMSLMGDVLLAITNGVYKPTNIMYACNLSWKSLTPLLEKLVHLKLVDCIRVGRHNQYYKTSKGLRIALGYRDLKKALS